MLPPRFRWVTAAATPLTLRLHSAQISLIIAIFTGQGKIRREFLEIPRKLNTPSLPLPYCPAYFEADFRRKLAEYGGFRQAVAIFPVNFRLTESTNLPRENTWKFGLNPAWLISSPLFRRARR